MSTWQQARDRAQAALNPATAAAYVEHVIRNKDSDG